jgi:hypothetical protein
VVAQGKAADPHTADVLQQHACAPAHMIAFDDDRISVAVGHQADAVLCGTDDLDTLLVRARADEDQRAGRRGIHSGLNRGVRGLRTVDSVVIDVQHLRLCVCSGSNETKAE